jgi:Xaa-Pro aminopeptidase
MTPSGMTPTEEMSAKVARLRVHAESRGYSAVLLASRNNFAWLTGGGCSRVNHSAEMGSGVLAVTRDAVVLLANNIEAPRLTREEVAGLPVELREFPWSDPSARGEAFRSVIADGPAACDIPIPGVSAAPDASLVRLRNPLLPPEVERYREAGRRVGAAVSEAARTVRPGMTEFEAAAELHRALLSRGAFPLVTLVASDERAAQFRHPHPNPAKRIGRLVMLVAGAEWKGLCVSASRMVGFGPVDADLRRRHDAVMRVDAALVAGTVAGRKIGEAFADGVAAYAANGFPDEWRHHHQGGPTGYAARDLIANSQTADPVQPAQAFAWNPTIAGTKSEDTILTRTDADAPPEVVSLSPDWPTVPVEVAGRVLPRPDILVR